MLSAGRFNGLAVVAAVAVMFAGAACGVMAQETDNAEVGVEEEVISADEGADGAEVSKEETVSTEVGNEKETVSAETGKEDGAAQNATGQTLRAEELNNRGLEYQKKKEHGNAIFYFTSAIQSNPNMAKYLYNRGMSYYERDRFIDAISDFSKAIELEPNEPKHRYWRMTAYSRVKDNNNMANDARWLLKVKDNSKEIRRYKSSARVFLSNANFYLEKEQKAAKQATIVNRNSFGIRVGGLPGGGGILSYQKADGKSGRGEYGLSFSASSGDGTDIYNIGVALSAQSLVNIGGGVNFYYGIGIGGGYTGGSYNILGISGSISSGYVEVPVPCGIEFNFSKLVLQIDMRPGYYFNFSGEGVTYGYGASAGLFGIGIKYAY
jgi:hypothetical protein